MKTFLTIPVLVASAAPLTASETWTVTVLNPPGAQSAYPWAMDAGLQVGMAGTGTLEPGYWTNGVAGSWTTLGSFPNGAWAEDISGTSVGGYTIEFDAFGDDFSEAALWNLASGGGYVNLHPVGATSSRVNAVEGALQGGQAEFAAGNHAVLWGGTAQNFVDLHPSGAASSFVLGMGPGQQIGYATFPFSHAGYWTGDAASFVDLHPSGQGLANLLASQGSSTDGQQQVGWIVFDEGFLIDHPALWDGDAAGFVDLLPSGWRDGKATGVFSGRQAGYARPSLSEGYRALLWSGSSESFVDLDALLPSGTYLRTLAYDVWNDGTNWYVVGAGIRPGFTADALLWSTPIVFSEEVSRLGSPPNPDVFLPGVTTGPVLGKTWDPVVDHANFLPAALADFLLLSPTSSNVPLPPNGTLLVQLGDFPIQVAAPGQPFQLPLPNKVGLIGASIATQAFSIDATGTPGLTNALDLVLGFP